MFYITKSKIHGVGLYASKDYSINDKLILAIENNHQITKLCSKVNHCNHPNSVLKQENDGWYLYSIKPIHKGEEITANYNYTPSFIKKPNEEWKC
jgi:hypothetical protein